MVQASTVEKRFIFNKCPKAQRFVSDDQGQVLGFNKLDNGNNIVYTKDLEGVEVAIEHCLDGTKIFHMEKDSKGLPAMHEFKPDGTEMIYLFTETKALEKTIELKNNGDKVTYWFSPVGDVISHEQRQKGGMLFRMKTKLAESMIYLKVDGEAECFGTEKQLAHIKKVFKQYLDGLV